MIFDTTFLKAALHQVLQRIIRKMIFDTRIHLILQPREKARISKYELY